MFMKKPMKIIFIFLKYVYIFGLVTVSIKIFIISIEYAMKQMKPVFPFISAAAIFLILFLSVLIHQSKLQVFCKDKKLVESIDKFDRRKWLKDEKIEAGEIFDRTKRSENNLVFDFKLHNKRKRLYPFGKAASHLIGYNDIEKGRAGLENCYHNLLFGKDRKFSVKNLSSKQKGNNLYLTIDSKLQQEAYYAFKERPGAAVVLIPKTGEVVCLVSSPGFQPNEISDDLLWENMINNKELACIFNRALKGRYPPGSIFKIITTAAAIENKLNKKYYSAPQGYLPSGSNRRIFDIEKRIYGERWKGHGLIDLKTAMEKSSNVYFSKLGVELNMRTVKKYAEKFGFNREIDWNSSNNMFKGEFFIKEGFFPDEIITDSDLAWASIGQHKVLVTPMQVALFTSAIANDGILVNPRIELNQKNKKGWRVIKKTTAKKLQDILRNVVKKGTGYRVNIAGLEVAGKTGTAEKTGGQNICWFTAFAPYNDAAIAVTVVVENGEYGGKDAAKIARKILIKAKRLGYFK